MKNFWKEALKKHNKLVFLAPMDWYWDSAYRQSIKKVSKDIFLISEFYSADWIIYSKFLADNVLKHDKIEDPLVIQIFWKDPEVFAKAWKIISDSKYNIAWIDINMWCPAKKVVKSWHWSGLIINEDIAYKIVEALNKSSKLPISVKTRLSFDWTQNLIKFAKWLENAWASLITVHGRTAKQEYTWIADFTQIYELKNHISIPVICNWDIKNYDDWMNKVKNLDWFMIWRASFWNPWCFLPWNYQANLLEILDMMIFHAKKLVKTKGESRWSLEIRKHLVQYLKWFPWVKNYRKRLVTTDNLQNTLNIIEEIKKEFVDFLYKKPSLWEIDIIK